MKGDFINNMASSKEKTVHIRVSEDLLEKLQNLTGTKKNTDAIRIALTEYEDLKSSSDFYSSRMVSQIVNAINNKVELEIRGVGNRTSKLMSEHAISLTTLAIMFNQLLSPKKDLFSNVEMLDTYRGISVEKLKQGEKIFDIANIDLKEEID